MGKQRQKWAIATFTAGLLIWGNAIAQTPALTPQITSSPTPSFTRQQQETIEQMVDERFEKSSRVNDRIQYKTQVGWAKHRVPIDKLVMGTGTALCPFYI